MTVKELKEAIQNLPDNMEVILQKDAEGNGYSPLSGADPGCIYVAKKAWYGDVYSAKWSAEDADMTEAEWESTLKHDRALVLYPIN